MSGRREEAKAPPAPAAGEHEPSEADRELLDYLIERAWADLLRTVRDKANRSTHDKDNL